METKVDSQRGERENMILMDMDKDKTLCASVTGRDNIPKVEKVFGQTDRDTCAVGLQRLAPERTWQDLPHWGNWAQTLGVCYGWRKGHAGVKEAAQQDFGRERREEDKLFGYTWSNVSSGTAQYTLNVTWMNEFKLISKDI